MNTANDNQTIPLMMLPPGKEGRVVEVRGGQGMRQRLSSMGIHPGQNISLIRGQSGGPVIVKVQESRVGIGRGMAHRVMVKQK